MSVQHASTFMNGVLLLLSAKGCYLAVGDTAADKAFENSQAPFAEQMGHAKSPMTLRCIER